MTHSRPFHRNVRQLVRGPNSGYSSWAYIVDRDYSNAPEHYVRAFLLIQGDLQRLFEFVEPSDVNLKTYSYRIHELFMRTCIEIEANFKAILKENIYNPKDQKNKPIPEKRWNIHNYKIVNRTHHLSSYKVHIPIWSGTQSVFEPFKQWAASKELSWYQAYNKSKHDRRLEFSEANLKNLVNSIAGLLVLLSSQFGTQDFSPRNSSLALSTKSYYPTQPALGGFFHIEFPSDWREEEQYEFNWSVLAEQPDRFQKIDYDEI